MEGQKKNDLFGEAGGGNDHGKGKTGAVGIRPDLLGRKVDRIAAEEGVELPPKLRDELRAQLADSIRAGMRGALEDSASSLAKQIAGQLVSWGADALDLHKRHALPAELCKIAAEGGHEVEYAPGAEGWLTWGSASSLRGLGDPSVFEALFSDSEIMKLSDGSEFPFSPSAMPRYVAAFKPENFDAEQEKARGFYEQAVRAFVNEETGHIDLRNQHGLIVFNGRLEKQLQVTGTMVTEGPLAAIRRILQVWFIETAHRLAKRIEAERIEQTDAEEEVEGLWNDAGLLWNSFEIGRCGEDLEEHLDAALQRRDTPPVLASHSKFGLMHVTRWRDGLLRYAYPLHRKHLICQSMLLSADVDEPVLGWDEMQQKWQQPPRHSFKWDKTWARRMRNVYTLLLVQDQQTGELIPRPGWLEGEPQDLFEKLAEQPGEEHLRGETPWRSIERYFKRKCEAREEVMPETMGEWVAKAREWAPEEPPPRLFDPA